MTTQHVIISSVALTLDEVKHSPQWVVWRLERQQRRLSKVLYDPTTNRRASTTNPTTWSFYAQAQRTCEHSRGYYQGVGLVFSPDLLPVMGVDFDHCVEQGQLAPWARAFIALLDSYTEDSPSGTGKHVLLLGSMPAISTNGTITHPGRKHCWREDERTAGRHPQAAVEMYSEGRFFTVTEKLMTEFPALLLPRQEQVLLLYQALFGNPTRASSSSQPERGALYLPDQRLLDKALAAKNGQVFQALWQGQRGPDASRDDYHLCCLLAFWTGNDAARVDRLFRQSGLMRDKWDAPRGVQTYGARTVEQAIAACHTVYTGPHRATPPNSREETHA